MQINQFLSLQVRNAMTLAGIPDDIAPMLAASKNASFGHYQANCAMATAKKLKKNPREVAQSIVDNLSLEGVADKIEIAGPGFINIHLANSWLAANVQALASDATVGIDAVDPSQTVVIDYSSPNLAKEMHVGHLRSTIIGDVLARVLETQGHKVIRQNHVGDWGTQFGMLITHLEDQLTDELQGKNAEIALADLEEFYRESKKRFDDEEGFANRARENVVRLQSGDASALASWKRFIAVSVSHSEEIYEQLNVTLKPEDIKAESAYNDELPIVINLLKNQQLVAEDQGAQAAFLEEFADKKGNITPVIVQKSDGGYLYATTDLAALRYRCHELNADRILYFIDARQSLHMKQIFTLGRKAGFANENTSLEHHPFGTMMGEDGKPFKTRTGGIVKLADLLTESVERAEALLVGKNSELPEDERKEVARKIGIGAIKYADLAKTRTNDYVFNWDAMLSFEGNTAPYLQYAYTRIRSIFRKAGLDSIDPSPVNITEPQESDLAIKLLQYPEIIDQVAQEAYPHLLCNYLYELTSLFMRFYESCPIMRSDIETEVRNSRLQIAQATAHTLQAGLDLLGIEVMERM